MRRLLAVITLVFGFGMAGSIAAAQEASPAPACPATSEDENMAIVMRWYTEVLNGQDLDLIDEIVAEEADHNTSTFTDSGNREETKAIVTALHASYPDLQNTVEETIAEDDLVVVRWTSSGTFQEAFQGVSPSGESHTWTGINIFRIECGAIAEGWNEVNRLAQTGQVEAPSATPVASDATTTAGASPAAACVAGSEEEHEAVAMRWYEEALNEQDLAVIDEIVADDHGHHTSLFEDSRLREDTKATLDAVFTALPDVTWTVDDMISVDDVVVVRWTGTGTFEAPLQGVPPTGEAQTFTGINIFRFECGLIVESWSEVDRFVMLGLDPSPSEDIATPAA